MAFSKLRDKRRKSSGYLFFPFFLFFFFFFILGPPYSIWKFPDQGSNQSCSCGPIPQPQQPTLQLAATLDP